MRYRRFLCAGAASLALLVGAAVSSQEAGAQVVSRAEGKCLKSALNRSPLLTWAGVWNGPDLVLLDLKRGSLLPYTPAGRAKMEPAGSFSKDLKELAPLRMATRANAKGTEIVIQAEGNRFLVASPGYTYTLPQPVDARNRVRGFTVERAYDWAPTRGKEIVAFADLKEQGTGKWATGVVRFPLDTLAGKQLNPPLANLSPDDASRKFHRLGYSLIGALEDNAYVLLMDSGFRLWKSEPDGSFKELLEFRDFFHSFKVPSLPNFIRPTDFSSVMSTVEESTMPTGVYGWEGHVYVVWRRSQAGGTEWLLSKVAPDNGKVLGTLTIPSRANHLFAVPGPRHWAFVEKGPALDLRDQEVLGVVTVEAANVRNARFSEAEADKAFSSLCGR